jgi:CRISPR-associated endonuclease/helicase Cas3
VADWIGSAEEWFPVIQETTPNLSEENAVCAINEIGFEKPVVKPGISFKDAFSFEPNDLQLKAEQTILNQGLYIIEAPMGMGKTEAALWCVYKQMLSGKASGFYFALPTQATSNRIYLRVNKFLDKITNYTAQSRLIHAGSWLFDEIKVPIISPGVKDEKEGIYDAMDWFASKKRGLLAPFGVGTVDQALMSVIAVKHFFVRQFGLAGKVVILDEVHSYDLYTGTLIKTLCERLLSLGCTVILLSATLTKESKCRFIKTNNELIENNYPLISGKNIKPVEVLKPPTKTIQIQMRNENDSLSEALKKALNGACVIWVCDTVNKAQEMFDRAQNGQSIIEIGLLHSRFPVFRRKELEEYWMEKLGKDNLERKGCILFSTQIVEQSVDLDADFMVSELAPTDMLLQRMGRLWRHERKNRPVDCPEFWILTEQNSFKDFKNASASKIKKMFGAKAHVYSPYVLLRSLLLWKNATKIKIPCHIRKYLERTYCLFFNEPSGWKKLQEELDGDKVALKQMAIGETNPWNLLLDDEEGKAKTRIGGIETTQLILCAKKEGEKRFLINGNSFNVNTGDNFIISTARSIHKNIVKVPKYCFSGYPEKDNNQTIYAHVRGDWQIGYVGTRENDYIESKYLDNNYKMRYTPEKGVEIMKTDIGNEADYEPCD